MRLLVPIRVSRDVEEGSSPEDQRDVAIEYADTHPGVHLIFTDTPDYDVSGATPIAERPGVKDWLEPGKINEWDAIGGSEMSRISRDMYDYLGFVRHVIDKRGKIVVDLSDGTDSSTRKGRQTLEDRILAAQRYREFVSEKRAAKARRLADQGRWDGGRIPYGYRPEKRAYTDDYGRERTAWYLVRDTGGTADIAERMVDDTFNGKSNRAISLELNAEGVPTSIGRTWRDNSVGRILTSPALAGYVVEMDGYRQKIRRDKQDQPIKFTDEPVISEDLWRELQDVLESRARRRGQAQARHMLWDVLFCGHCSQPCEDALPCAEHDVKLYGQRRVSDTSKPNVYWCKQCQYQIRLELAESYVETRLLREQGHRPLLEAKTIRGTDNSAELIKLEKQIERFRRELDLDPDDEDLRALIAKREAQRDQLNTGPREPDRVEWVPAEPPRTIAQHWHSLTSAKARNDWLRAAGATFYADRDGIIGQLGWHGLDNPADAGAGLHAIMRSLKLPVRHTWDQARAYIAKRLESLSGPHRQE